MLNPQFRLNPMKSQSFHMFPFLFCGEISLKSPYFSLVFEANFLIAPRPQKDGQPWVAVYVPQSSALDGGCLWAMAEGNGWGILLVRC